MADIRRFYKTVSVTDAEGGQQVLLDGRPVRTPAKRPLLLPTSALAAAIGEEWDAQVEAIRPAAMPLTQLASTAIDRVTPQRDRVIDEIAGYAATDVLCYRADAPEALVRWQRERWQPLLDWAARMLDAPLTVTAGIIACEQPAGSLAAIRRAVAANDDFRLAPLHVMASVTGSVVTALALAQGAVDAETAWAAGQADEDWQIRQWGEDPVAAERRARLRAELDAAMRFLSLL